MSQVNYFEILKKCPKCRKNYSRAQFDECPHRLKDPLAEKIATEGIEAATKWWWEIGRYRGGEMSRLLSNEEIKEIIGYTHGYNVQPADRKIAKAQHKKSVEWVLDRVIEDFVEPIINLYVDPKRQESAWNIWHLTEKELNADILRTNEP